MDYFLLLETDFINTQVFYLSRYFKVFLKYDILNLFFLKAWYPFLFSKKI